MIPDNYGTDPEARTIAGWIRILQIIGKYAPNLHPLAHAEHDIVYLNLTTEDCPEDSEDGEELSKLGLFVEDGYSWACFT